MNKIRLEDVVLVVSDDSMKTNLEIICTICAKHLADVQHEDTMQVLYDLAVEHLATHKGA